MTRRGCRRRKFALQVLRSNKINPLQSRSLVRALDLNPSVFFECSPVSFVLGTASFYGVVETLQRYFSLVFCFHFACCFSNVEKEKVSSGLLLSPLI